MGREDGAVMSCSIGPAANIDVVSRTGRSAAETTDKTTDKTEYCPERSPIVPTSFWSL